MNFELDTKNIVIPSNDEIEGIFEHVKIHYSHLFNRADIKAKSKKSLSLVDEYVELVSSLKEAIILPDGSELLNPFKKELPVGCVHPKTLKEALNSTLNVGQIIADHEARMQAAYNEEKEYELFEDLKELAYNNPDRWLSLYEDAGLPELHSSYISRQFADAGEQTGDIPRIENGTQPSQEGTSTKSDETSVGTSTNNVVKDAPASV